VGEKMNFSDKRVALFLICYGTITVTLAVTITTNFFQDGSLKMLQAIMMPSLMIAAAILCVIFTVRGIKRRTARITEICNNLQCTGLDNEQVIVMAASKQELQSLLNVNELAECAIGDFTDAKHTEIRFSVKKLMHTIAQAYATNRDIK
jgi:hypothetical protein